MIAYESEVDGGESHVALVRGNIEHSATPVQCDARPLPDGRRLGATGCECHATLEGALRRIFARRLRRADLPASDFTRILIEKIGDRHRRLASHPRTKDFPRYMTMAAGRSAKWA